MADGFTFLIHEDGGVGSIVFPHLGASSTGNQFKNMNAGSVVIPPFGAARVTYKNGYLRFA